MLGGAQTMFYHQTYKNFIDLYHIIWKINNITGAYAPIEYKVASPLIIHASAVCVAVAHDETTTDWAADGSTSCQSLRRVAKGCISSVSILC